MRKVGLAIAAVVAAALAGCARQDTSTFQGKVTYQGQPVTSGVIYFLGPAPDMRMGMGTIHDDGTYAATDVPVGQVRVAFQAPGIPRKYADPNTTPLVFTITAGMTALDINVPPDP
jgi:hypothetical protein